jgi:CheY-like chemotaxis protein
VTDRSEASPAFVDAVHQALQHLYDPDKLSRSDLLEWLGMGDRAGAPELRRAILNGINELKPGLEARKEARAWRPYRALYHRHVEQFTQREVSVALALSIRQLRREEQRGLTRLAEILWSRYDVGRRFPMAPDRTARDPARQEPPSREEELEWLERSVDREVVDVAAVVESVLGLTAPLARQLGVAVTWQPPDGPACALAQMASIRQALVNVVSFALRQASGGRVELTLGTQTARLFLTLRYDSSHGVPRPILPDSDEHLRMARQLLELSGGSLDLELASDRNAGTIILSLREADRHPTVLVIDDNADTLRLVERYLTGSRFTYAGARDPEQALALAERLSPAAVVLDVMLPGIDGWELLGRLRTHPKTAGVPIIVCTILPEEHLALSLGAAEFLRKPVSRRVLLAALQRQVATAWPGGG